ncbi:MAG: DUF4397 domain-containing protein [Ginsengibacter sp.]
MKKNILIILLCICTVVVLHSCDKNHDYTAPTVTTEGLAFLKIADFSPSFRQATNGRDSINIYVNGTKVNGTFLTYNNFFPASTSPYIGVPAGPQSIRITSSGTISPDSITLGSFNKTLTAGSYYSFIITDSVLKGNEANQIFLKDNFAVTDTGHFTLRFVHAVLNDTLGKNVDIFSTLYNTNIFTNIAPGTATAFLPFQYTTATDALIVRRAGTLFTLATLSAASFSRQRAYTIVYKGQPDKAFSATTAPKGRSLVQYTNY